MPTQETRLNRTASTKEIMGEMESESPKEIACPCGAKVDTSGMGSFASLLTHCDSCANRINREADEKRQHEAEARRREAARRVALSTWEETVPKRYRETDENHPEFPKGLFKFAMNWIEGKEFDGEPRREWIGLIGTAGKGKTRVMSRIMRLKIWDGQTVAWVNANQFQWCAQNQHDSDEGKKARAFLRKFRTVDFLAFDDLGKQRWTDTVESQFFDLIEARYSEVKDMAWTSNASLSKLKTMLSTDRAEPIAGRLSEASNIAEL